MTIKKSNFEKALKRNYEETDKRHAKFFSWLVGLSQHDRFNFIALINLPNAKETIGKCPDKILKEMALIALEIKAKGGVISNTKENENG